MNSLSTLERGPNGTLSRPLVDVFGFDPFRNFFSSLPAAIGVEINRDETGYTVEVPVPGFKPDDIDITLENDTLTVSGKSEKRSFTRSLLLPEEIDSEKIAAKVEHGLLTLNLKLSPKAQPKKIAIHG